MRRVLAISFVLAALVGLVTVGDGAAAAGKEAPCKVGQYTPPPLPPSLSPPGGPRFSSTLTLACGHALGRSIALKIGIEHDRGERAFCFELDVGGGSCKRDDESWAEYCAEDGCEPRITPYLAFPGTETGGTTIYGIAPVGTAKMVIRAGSAAKEVKVRAMLANFDGELMRRFGEDEPAVIFGTAFAGCFAPPAVRHIALGPAGEVLERGRGAPFGIRPCGTSPFHTEPDTPTAATGVE